MKKSIFKLMSTAVALTALASCTDDLGMNSPKSVQGADMVATLEQFSNGNITRMVALDNGGVAGMTGISWEVGEQIRVFTLENLQQDLYEVTVANGKEGTFKKVEDNSLSGQQYAITMSDAIYGISSSKDKDGGYKPLLTVTLPDTLKPTAVTNGKAQFPVPYWGEVNKISGSESNADVQASMRALTAFLRVNLDELPDGTKYIVLTTHGALPYQEGQGFMLAKFGAEVTDTKEWWYAKDGDDYTHTWITDGYSEPISGTLNTFLNASDAQLSIDERLVNKDYIVVDLENLKNAEVKAFYLPIVCGTYKNLHVIAASYVSEKYTYCYAGTELMDFQDQEFVRNTAYYLDMGLVNLGEADMNTINEAIATKSTKKGLTTIFNVDKLVASDDKTDNPVYSSAQIETTTDGNVVLNITEIAQDFTYGVQETNPLIVTDKSISTTVEATTKIKGGSAKLNKFVQVNVPSTFKDADTPFYMSVTEGAHDLIMGTSDGANADKFNVSILGSATKFAKSYSLVNAINNTVIDNETHAAVILKRGFGIVNIVNPTKGDVYAYTPSQAENETEIVKALLISTKEATGIRLDNSLVGDLGFSDGAQAADNRQVFTTGSSAIKNVCNSTALSTTQGATNAVENPYATPSTTTNTAGRVSMRSYWTGAALSAYAITNGYDRPTVYTVAQLASVGEGIYSEGNSNHETATDEADPRVAEYNIPTALVRLMWLGGKEYKWIGARARIDGFTLDGENVELKNINMIEEWDGPNSWIDDPHWCCTTCWKPAITPSQIKLDKNFGLIRSVINSDGVTIKNVNLNDVDFQTQLAVANVGSIVGYVETDALSMTNNKVGEVKINVPADSIGGMAGNLKVETMNIQNNEVTGLKNNSGFITGKGYVGGLIGYAKNSLENYGDDKENISYNKIKLSESVKATDNGYVGGIVGSLNISNAKTTSISSNYVEIPTISAVKKSYAGGIAGNLLSDIGQPNGVTLNSNQVIAKDITAADNFAAGLVGDVNVAKGNVLVVDAATNPQTMVTVKNELKAGNQYAGGLFGKVTLNADNTESLYSAKVAVKNLEATNGFAGGFVGQILQGKTLVGISNPAGASRNYKNEITIEKMTSLYAAGGVIGNNAQSTKTPVTVKTGINTTTGNTAETHINVKAWAKTEGTFAGQDNYKYGTMSNIIGHMQDDLIINTDKSKVADYAYLTVIDNMDAATKLAVEYYKHNDELHNLETISSIEEMGLKTGQFYWGDANGYVGVRETGKYTIGGTAVAGEQLTPQDLPGHNQFKVGEDWVADKSKWQK